MNSILSWIRLELPGPWIFYRIPSWSYVGQEFVEKIVLSDFISLIVLRALDFLFVNLIFLCVINLCILSEFSN